MVLAILASLLLLLAVTVAWGSGIDEGVLASMESLRPAAAKPMPKRAA